MKKQVQVLQYPAVFTPAEEGGYVVTFPDFPELATQGETFEEARDMAADILQLWFEELKEQGRARPAPSEYPLIAGVEARSTA